MDCFVCKKTPAEHAFRVPMQRGHGLPGQAGQLEHTTIEVPTCGPCLQSLTVRERRCGYVMGAVILIPALGIAILGSDDGFRGFIYGLLMGAGLGLIPAVLLKIFVFARGPVYEYPPIQEKLAQRWTYS